VVRKLTPQAISALGIAAGLAGIAGLIGGFRTMFDDPWLGLGMVLASYVLAGGGLGAAWYGRHGLS